jgi:probable rRNA maturation factor
MIELTLQNNTSATAYDDSFFKKVLSVCIKELKLKHKTIEIGIRLVGEKKIADLNREFRGKDKATDVLSFPLDAHELEKIGVKALGDIFICLPIAKKNAKRDNVSMQTMIARLVVHGFLHLNGYDHERSEKDEREMFGIEEKILKKINL